MGSIRNNLEMVLGRSIKMWFLPTEPDIPVDPSSLSTCNIQSEENITAPLINIEQT